MLQLAERDLVRILGGACFLIFCFVGSACYQLPPAADTESHRESCVAGTRSFPLPDGAPARMVRVAFFRTIGRAAPVSSREGRVFCLVELEWSRQEPLPAGPEAGDRLRRPHWVLDAPFGLRYPTHPAAETAFRSLHHESTEPEGAVPPGEPAHDVAIFEVDLVAAWLGLTLYALEPAGGRPAGGACLDQYLVR